MNIHAIFNIILPLFRRRRMREFVKIFAPSSKTVILDVGGSSLNWKLIDIKSSVTLLNLTAPEDSETDFDQFKFVIGNGLDLKYTDSEFDICFSNSVIEHVGSFEDQRNFANEIRRVGRKIWVQTPARSFFFEPHYLTPFVHFFSKNIQRKLLRNFTVWGLLTRPDKGRVEQFLSEIRLLTYDEMKELFPDCEIRKEKLLFFTKSFVAIRK
jgi:ubiquinone/menaquinone biosynthesis C-methylase UbiE